MLTEVERQRGNARVRVYISQGPGAEGIKSRCGGKSVARMVARTTAAVRRYADKEHRDQEPKMRRQTNLRTLEYSLALRLLRACTPVSIP